MATVPAGGLLLGAALLAWAPLQGEAILDLDRRVLDLERRVIPYDGSTVTELGTEVTITLDTDVLFDFDSATLTAQAEATLSDLATELDESLAGDTVTVIGHTDSKGEDGYNQDLSEQRAEAVRAFLEPRLGQPVSFVVEGRGESEPVAANETVDGEDDPEGRRRNRRVEVRYEQMEPGG